MRMVNIYHLSCRGDRTFLQAPLEQKFEPILTK